MTPAIPLHEKHLRIYKAMPSALRNNVLTCHSVKPEVPDSWCDTNCNHPVPNCPEDTCVCDGDDPRVCCYPHATSASGELPARYWTCTEGCDLAGGGSIVPLDQCAGSDVCYSCGGIDCPGDLPLKPWWGVWEPDMSVGMAHSDDMGVDTMHIFSHGPNQTANTAFWRAKWVQGAEAEWMPPGSEEVIEFTCQDSTNPGVDVPCTPDKCAQACADHTGTNIGVRVCTLSPCSLKCSGHGSQAVVRPTGLRDVPSFASSQAMLMPNYDAASGTSRGSLAGPWKLGVPDPMPTSLSGGQVWSMESFLDPPTTAEYYKQYYIEFLEDTAVAGAKYAHVSRILSAADPRLVLIQTLQWTGPSPPSFNPDDPQPPLALGI